MITPRRTRLVRVPDLHAFREAICSLWRSIAASERVRRDPLPPASLIVVPTRSAARQLSRTLWRTSHVAPQEGSDERSEASLVTRDQLYESLCARLQQPPRRSSEFERDAIALAAAAEASADLPLPFQLRPGLVVEILRFYDLLRRQSQQATRFEELIEDAFAGAATDVGAERMLQQTRFLARTLRAYERRTREGGACDEHGLRDQLLTQAIDPPLRHVIVTVADWIADPDGLFAADFDLLARLPGLETIDIVCTEAVLGSGFHERLHSWWPGLEEAESTGMPGGHSPPTLLTPAGSDQLWFTVRDREEELVSVARRVRSNSSTPLDRVAVVFKRPLPYLYLAPETLGAADIAYQASHAMPLAAEPFAAAVDLVLDFVETDFTRDATVALLGSPHFAFAALPREAIAALDRALSKARYLGDLARLEELARRWEVPEAKAAIDAACAAAYELAPLLTPRPAADQIRLLLSFLEAFVRPLEAGDDPIAARERRARTAIAHILTSLASAREAHHNPAWTIVDLAASVRRWIQEETFVSESIATGVHLIDDQAARYGDFDDIAIVGLLENEWPERGRRNVFYPPAMLRTLGWPTEKDRRPAEDARFLDLLASASRRVAVTTITLDDDALVSRSMVLDDIPRARLTTAAIDASDTSAVLLDEALAASTCPDDADALTREWAMLRADRPPADSPEFHGTLGTLPECEWSVSALETYLACPFKFFAQHVLHLEEEPVDEEVMDPRRQGEFVHRVFEAFFKAWQDAGRGGITATNLDEARAMFTAIVDRALEDLPDAEAGLERTRLLGSSAAAGLGEAVLRMEAERPIAVVERLLEHRLRGEFTIDTDSGIRRVRLRGKADRLDLLADGTFRLIDYKLGWPPDKTRALQLPIYGLCAEQQLADYRGRRWTLGEASYLAFKGPKRVVPLFSAASQRDDVLRKAQQRLADTLDAIERGDFPPTPDDVYRCETCSYAAVCRKDYVGDI